MSSLNLASFCKTWRLVLIKNEKDLDFFYSLSSLYHLTIISHLYSIYSIYFADLVLACRNFCNSAQVFKCSEISETNIFSPSVHMHMHAYTHIQTAAKGVKLTQT